ncbi:helix-turn-helix domain-containing protein [Streptomyces sp. YH02]|uniref:helix-turn-helix domain-containing protein n=1 Tax=Streptomyces sp. YH02 TaxID=3256999 RepID=UPI00375825DF
MSHDESFGFSLLLQNARKRADLTQQQLAELSTVSVRAIRDLELERTLNPRRETVRLLADALRLTGARRAELELAARGGAVGDVLKNMYDVELAAPPASIEPIVGRQHDVRALTGLLESEERRLVTIVGVAGVGKTRLAQEVARVIHVRGRMPVIWVPTVGAVPPGSERGIDRPTRSPGIWVRSLLNGEQVLDDLVSAVGDGKALLVVDSQDMERGTESALRQLLYRCPGLQVLYTARETSLSADGDLFPLSPLPVSEFPPGVNGVEPVHSPAVQLMLSHCTRLRPDIVQSPEIVAAIAHICWALDGIPQALGSAASWLLLYEPIQLLEIALRSPFALTMATSDGMPDLADLLARNVATLRPQEASLLQILAGLDGPWTMKQAVDLLRCSSVDSARGLRTLRTRGLVRQVRPDAEGCTQFVVLHLVRRLVTERNCDLLAVAGQFMDASSRNS